jgi:hypothetical protein
VLRYLIKIHQYVLQIRFDVELACLDFLRQANAPAASASLGFSDQAPGTVALTVGQEKPADFMGSAERKRALLFCLAAC